MPATISVNFANQVEVEGPTPPTNKSVNASVLKGTLTSGNISGGYLRLASGSNQNVAGPVSLTTGTGSIRLSPGNASAAGFVSWFRPDGTTRIAYMGWNPDGANNLGLSLENGARLRIMGDTGNVKIDGSLEVGSITVGSSFNPIVPVGAVMPFARNTAPTGWLLCNGDGIPNGNGTVQGVTADFSGLFAILAGAFGTVSGQNRLPNMQGIFVRGSGSQTIGSNNYTGTFAAKQEDSFRSHQHAGTTGNDSPDHVHGYLDRYTRQDSGGGSGGGSSADGAGDLSRNTYGANTRHQHPFSTDFRGGTETQPANIALLYCIKY